MNAHATADADAIRMIPLDQLELHPINPRQEVDQNEIDALSEGIAIAGLLQNLVGLEEDGIVRIVAGGKRLRALKKLASDGSMGRLDVVPVKVTDDPLVAQAWAVAENVARSDLHPADEVRAYRAMSDRGSSIMMIARTFAKPAKHVQRRLTLADLPDTALDALRADRISLDVAKALTVANDPNRQQEVLEAAMTGHYGASWVRRELTEKMIRSSDRRARFVGNVRYVEAGGAMTRDLFEDCAFLHDEALLDRLFREALECEAERVKAEEGWSEAVPVPDGYVSDIAQRLNYQRIFPTPVDLPEADANELERLNDLAETEALSDDDRRRMRELERRADGDFSDEDRDAGIVFVSVDYYGKLQIQRAWRRRNDTNGESGDAAGGGITMTGGEQKPRVPTSCLEDLRRARLLALQTAMLGRIEDLLDLLAYQVEVDGSSYAKPLAVTFTRQTIMPEKASGLLVSERLADPTPGRGRDVTVAGFEEFRTKGKKHRNDVLMRALVRTIPDAEVLSKQLFDLLSHFLDAAGGATAIRAVWTPDSENFFGRIRQDYLDEIWAEVLELDADDDRRAEFAQLKKSDKAKELARLFSDSSVQEAHGLSREQIKRLDSWVPREMWSGE